MPDTTTLLAGREQLRTRAVLFEGDRERAQEARRRGRKPGQRANLAHLEAEQLASFPLLAAHVAEHGGFPPRTRTGSASDAAPRIARLERMAAQAGELVLITWLLRPLDRLPLKSAALAEAGRKSVEGMLRLQAPRLRAHDTAIQRGDKHGCTHSHTVAPLADVSRALQAAALAAPSGRGGGAWHIPGKLHIVRIGSTREDLERVAGYLSRDPDCRFDLPEDHPDCLQGHEQELARKRSGARSPRLTWFKLPRNW